MEASWSAALPNEPVWSRPRVLVWAMVAAVALANVLMPVALTPFVSLGTPVIAMTFLINEVAHRRHGPAVARQIALRGFVAALALSLLVAPFRIACASATAFLLSQLLDIAVFRRLRRGRWWLAPLCASTLASTFDTVLFFALAFAGTDGVDTWWRFVAGDLVVKSAMDLAVLVPFRAAMRRVPIEALPAAIS